MPFCEIESATVPQVAAVEIQPRAEHAAVEGGIYSDMASTISGLPLPSVAQLQLQSSPPEAEPGTCGMCLCTFQPQDLVIQIPCNERHVFHENCISTWLQKSQECPICQTNVVEAFKKEEERIMSGPKEKGQPADIPVEVRKVPEEETRPEERTLPADNPAEIGDQKLDSIV